MFFERLRFRIKSPISLKKAKARQLNENLRCAEGMISDDEAKFLYQAAKLCPYNLAVVEVGSYRGLSSVALGTGSLHGCGARVYAIDPHEEYRGVLGGHFDTDDRGRFYQAMLKTGCFHSVSLLNLKSESAARCWELPIGVLWIDGDHSYDGVKKDFLAWSPFLDKEGVLILDDVNHEELGPYKLLNELIDAGAYRVHMKIGKMVALKQC